MAFFKKNKNKSQSYKLGEEIGTGKIIAIKDAQNGLKCNCICSDCKAPFEAIQGQKNEWHFRHHNKDTNCKGGQETALHLLAKEIICRNTEMIVFKNTRINYTYSEIEKYVAKDINPDVVAIFNNERICFEVVVKNPLTIDKEMKYIRNEIKCIEIDLSKYEFKSEEELENYILNTSNKKKVVFWKKTVYPTLTEVLFLLGFIIGIPVVLFYFSKPNQN